MVSTRRSPRALYVAGAVIVLTLAVLWQCRRLLSGAEVLDLKVYLAGGRAVLHDQDLYSPRVGVRQYGFTYPPFAGLLFAAPSLLGTGWSIVLMTACSLAALAVLVRLSGAGPMGRPVAPRSLSGFAVVVAMIACQPVRTTLWNGQVDLILAALVMVDLVARRDAPGEGVLVGLAAAIKLTPAVFVIYLLLRRRFRAAGTACATFAIVTGGSWLVLPHDSTKYWTSSLYRGTGIGDVSRASNQSLLGVAERLIGSPAARPVWASLVVPVLVLGLGVAARISADGRESFALAVVGITGCLVSPVSWSHHWVWFVPWMAGLVSAPARDRGPRIAAVVFIVYLVAINAISQPTIHRFGIVRVLIQNSYALAVAIACLFALASARRHRRPPFGRDDARAPASDATLPVARGRAPVRL